MTQATNHLVQPMEKAVQFKPAILLKDGAVEIFSALKNYYVAVVFGWQDIAQRYRRSKVGAFWITISVAIMIGMLSLLFGALFRAPLHDFLPFVAIGMILWTFISSMIAEGCTAFIEASGMILQTRLSLFTHILRITWRNLIILGHNLIILPIVLFVMHKFPEPVWILALPGFALVLINLTWISLLLAILSTRFRDIIQAVQSLIQIAFFMTPIMWMPQTLSDRVPQYILEFNPFFHLLALVRSPLLGHSPDTVNWLASLGLAVLGWLATLMVFGRFRRRIPYWL
jgi:ABC-type polysaccharide/polyol phosphate export permease